MNEIQSETEIKRGYLYLSYYNKLAEIKEKFPQAYICAVATSIPKGCDAYIDEHMKALAPSSIFRKYKEGELLREEFSKQFRKEITNKKEALIKLKEVKTRIANGQNVFFICYEKETTTCHRNDLAIMLYGKDKYLDNVRIYPKETEIYDYINLNNVEQFLSLTKQYYNEGKAQSLSQEDLTKIDTILDFITNYRKLNKPMNVEFNSISEFVSLHVLNRLWLSEMKEIALTIYMKDKEKLKQQANVLSQAFHSEENIKQQLEKIKKKNSKTNTSITGIDYIDQAVTFNKKIKNIQLDEEDLEIINEIENKENEKIDVERYLFMKRLGKKCEEYIKKHKEITIETRPVPIDNDVLLAIFLKEDLMWLKDIILGLLEKVSDYWVTKMRVLPEELLNKKESKEKE